MKQTKPCLQGSLSGPRSVYTYVCLGICVMWLTLCRQVASKRIRDGCSLGISQLNSICHYSKGGSEGTGLRGQTMGAITIAPVAQTQVPHPLSSCLQPASPVRSDILLRTQGHPAPSIAPCIPSRCSNVFLPMINEQSPTDKKAFSFS